MNEDTDIVIHPKYVCPIHGEDCPGDDGGFFIDGNHPDDMFSLGPVTKQKIDE